MRADGGVEASAHYGRAINRIRTYYRQVAGRDARYLLLTGHDDVLGVLATMGVFRPSRWGLIFTLASMIGVLNSMVGGTAVAFLVGAVFGASLGAAAGAGGVAAIVSAFAHSRWQQQHHREASESAETLFPSPTPTR